MSLTSVSFLLLAVLVILECASTSSVPFPHAGVPVGLTFMSLIGEATGTGISQFPFTRKGVPVVEPATTGIPQLPSVKRCSVELETTGISQLPYVRRCSTGVALVWSQTPILVQLEVFCLTNALVWQILVSHSTVTIT